MIKEGKMGIEGKDKDVTLDIDDAIDNIFTEKKPKKEEKPNELKISYKYIDSIVLDNGRVCLANNKDFEMKEDFYPLQQNIV